MLIKGQKILEEKIKCEGNKKKIGEMRSERREEKKKSGEDKRRIE